MQVLPARDAVWTSAMCVTTDTRRTLRAVKGHAEGFTRNVWHCISRFFMITYPKGDVTVPPTNGPKLIAHVVNDCHRNRAVRPSRIRVCRTDRRKRMPQQFIGSASNRNKFAYTGEFRLSLPSFRGTFLECSDEPYRVPSRELAPASACYAVNAR